QHLLPGKSLPPPILLDDDEGAFLPPLVGGKPAAARLALPPAPHRGALIHRAGFEHLGVAPAAVRTSHRSIPLPGKPPSMPLYHGAYGIVDNAPSPGKAAPRPGRRTGPAAREGPGRVRTRCS